MHYHSQNLTDGRLPKWRYGRAWLGSLSLGWNIFYRTNLCLAKIGARGFAVYFFWFGFYLSWSRREDDGEFCRHFEVSIHDGNVWIEHPWVRADEWRSRDPWWRKQIVLRVGDWILGKQRCEVTKGTPVEVFVPMPEGSYRAIATPETMIWRRRFYVPMRRRDDVTIDIPVGIPFAGKGENSWDCGDDGLFGTSGDTVDDAISNCVRSALRQRRRRGHDIHGTGKSPAIIVDAKEPRHDRR